MDEIKLVDIADQMGISISTVSRALKSKPPYDNPVHAEIVKLAKKLGYKNNRPVRRAGKLDKVALLTIGYDKAVNNGINYQLGYSPDGFLGRIVYGVERAIRKHGGMVTIYDIVDMSDAASKVIRLARENDFKAVILCADAEIDGIEALSEYCAVVQVNTSQSLIRTDSVASDDFGGITLAVNRLIQLGHQRIAFWVNRPTTSSHHMRRIDGYRNAIYTAGLPYERVYFDSPTVQDSFFDCMKIGFEEYLNDPEKPSAIICACDSFAWAILRMAHEYGINIPGDLSIVGFDNIDLSSHVYPSLSTVDAHLERMPEVAVELLTRRIANPSALCRQVTLQASFVERESTAQIV